MTDPAGTVALEAVVTAPTISPASVIAAAAAACVRPTTAGTATFSGPDDTTRVIAVPLATCVPAAGVWLMTEPDGTVLLAAVVSGPSFRPAPVIAVVAAACVRPTTSGTATCGSPEDTTSATGVPLATCVPAAGVWLITEPDGTVVLVAVVNGPGFRPASVIAVVAAACVSPTTFGTATCGGPDDTTSDTALPTATWVAAEGDWLMTDPAGTVALVAVVTVPRTRPALVIAVVAAACARPTTFGTATCGGPDETTSETELPLATCAAPVGV